MNRTAPSPRWHRPVIAACLAVALGSGCAVPWTGKDGTRHHLVLGLGLISLQQATNQPVSVVRSTLAGISVGDPLHLFQAGLSSSLTTQVADNSSNVVVETKLLPGGRIRLQTNPQTKVQTTKQP